MDTHTHRFTLTLEVTMAQYTTLVPHSEHVEEFVTRYPSAKGCISAHEEKAALEVASEKFLDDHRRWGGDPEEEWIMEAEELSAYPIYDKATYEVIIGWGIESV